MIWFTWRQFRTQTWVTLGALIVIPLAVLAGLFVWLKLTEEDDEEALELDEDV